MKVSFRYPFASACEVPDGQLMGMYEPGRVPDDAAGDPRMIVEAALDEPAGIPPLDALVEPGQTVTIVVDDITRTTPTDLLLDVLLPKLERAGVRRRDITILLALGTHRDMTPLEIRDRLGGAVADRYRIVNHHARVTNELTHCGTTVRGTEAIVNRAAADADLLIGCGHIVPHRVSGFSGGGKIVTPGIASHLCIGQVHWLSAQFPGEQITGIRDNPVRTEIDGVAELAGLRFVLNVVQDGSGRTVYAVAGEPIEAHRQGARLAEDFYRIELPEPADIVVADSYPSDIDMWQAAKALFACGLAVKQHGTIIMVSPCPEGAARTHPDVLEYGYTRWREVTETARHRQFPDMVAAAHICEAGAVIDRARTILVSEGIDAETAGRLGMEWAATPQAALDMAIADAGPSASVAVFSQIAELAPTAAT